MFWQSAASYQPTFQLENHFSPAELACYKARAQALRPRFPWSAALLPVWNVTLIHLSQNVPGKVGYFASVKNLVENRITRTSPEMFLERTLTYAPDEIRAAWAVEVLGQILPEVLFIKNDDPDGWEMIYDRGPNSCMASSSLVRQYAHPKNNLALAYIKKNGKITHRTIVNTANKTYLRIYGGEDVEFFVAALNKLGYSHSYDTLKDEIIHAGYISCRYCERDVLQGPYLDGHHQGLKLLNRKEGQVSNGGDDLYSGEEDANCGCDGDEEYDED